MSQLVVRNIEEKVVRQLKARAGRNGVSVEEEHRRILRQVLLEKSGKYPSFKEYLQQMPDFEPESLLKRKLDTGRPVKL